MTHSEINPKRLAQAVGWSILLMILIGVGSSLFLTSGIDINLTADVGATAENMLQAEQRLRAKAYLGVLALGLEVLFALGLFHLLRGWGWVLAAWSVVASLVAATLTLFGSVFAMNAAELAANPAYLNLNEGALRLPLAALQATSDYTSFHLSLVISSWAKAGLFYLLLVSRLIPRLISGWGIFASLFVASAIVIRDFVPVMGNNIVTMMFMVSNLIALVSLGVYLAFWGVREQRLQND